MTFWSRSLGWRPLGPRPCVPSQPQKDRPIESVAGPQLFQPWYSWRTPSRTTRVGMGVGINVGSAVMEGIWVGPGVRVGVGAVRLARTAATTAGAGGNTTSSGGVGADTTPARTASPRTRRGIPEPATAFAPTPHPRALPGIAALYP